jgi:hypothetical protein
MALWMACASMSSRLAAADTVYTTFGGGDGYDALNGAQLEGPASGFPQAVAEQFLAPGNYYLDAVEVPLSPLTSQVDLRIELYSDLAGSPGTLLASNPLTVSQTGIVRTEFDGSVLLSQGSRYWIGVLPAQADQLIWHDSLSAEYSQQALTEDDGASWLTYSSDPFPGAAYRIEGTPLDSPSKLLVNPAAAWRYFPGRAEPSGGTAWTTATFDDTSWSFDFDGFGYDADPATAAGLLSQVQTPLLGMQDNGINDNAYSTLYLRREFMVEAPAVLASLILSLDYDDSFIAYINGVEVTRSNFGLRGVPEPFDGVGAEHESSNGEAGVKLEQFVIDLVDDFPDLLTPGARNVLAIQGLNASLDDDDFLLAQISLGATTLADLLTGDFNRNGIYDCEDIDALVANIAGGSYAANFDLSGDRHVDLRDLDLWRAEAGLVVSPSGGPIPMGDANLDGSVDASDLGAWADHRFSSIASWCSGDFNADGAVDVRDFGFWNSNKGVAKAIAIGIPEPQGLLMLLGAGVAGLLLRRGHRD